MRYIKQCLNTAWVIRIMLMGVVCTASVPGRWVAAVDSQVTGTALYRQAVPVTYDGRGGDEISLDPQLAFDAGSLAILVNLYDSLTTFDPNTNQIIPRMAVSWETSSDGLIWTFNLRNDVMWYRYDPLTDTAQAMRPVVAEDFRYAIQRSCDSRLEGRPSYIVADCDIVNGTPVEQVTDELVFGETTQVFAPDDQTLEIHFQYAAGYMLSILGGTVPVYREAIEQYGDDWTTVGNMVTMGPFFLKENIRGVHKVFVRNLHYPSDLRYGGNIDIVRLTIIEEEAAFALYLNNQLDQVGLPRFEFDRMSQDPVYQTQIHMFLTTAVQSFAFSYAPPFDNVHVRRAFSAVIDREAFVEQTSRVSDGLPMIHFTPPGIPGAPPMDEVGVGFDPDYARAEMAAAGYQNCQGFPPIRIVTFERGETQGEFVAAAAEKYLGCDSALFDVEGLPWAEQVEATNLDNPLEDLPAMWTIWWVADYPDANNYLHDVLSCAVGNTPRPCTEVDNLIDQAAREPDFRVRNDLYRQIEEAFFGYEGEFPIAPVKLYINRSLIQPWLTGPFDTQAFGFGTFDMYTIDMAAKLAARGQ